MDVIAAPDVFVNASVALGSAPEQATRRLLSGKDKAKTSKWVLDRVAAMLGQAPGFRAEAVEAQMSTIRSLTTVVEEADHGATDWQAALVSAAKQAGVTRVLTDHPDLLELGTVEGVDFIGTEEWLLERSVPPPTPGD